MNEYQDSKYTPSNRQIMSSREQVIVLRGFFWGGTAENRPAGVWDSATKNLRSQAIETERIYNKIVFMRELLVSITTMGPSVDIRPVAQMASVRTALQREISCTLIQCFARSS